MSIDRTTALLATVQHEIEDALGHHISDEHALAESWRQLCVHLRVALHSPVPDSRRDIV